MIKPTSFEELRHIQETVTTILRKYVDDFHRIKREQWESKQMIYQTLEERDPNLSFNKQSGVKEGKGGGYVVSIPRNEKSLVSTIHDLITHQDELYRQESEGLPRIYFDRHLYQPLLVSGDPGVKLSPPGLNSSEAQFVRDLKQYWADERNKSYAGLEVFLLRNLSRGSGVGFFEERGFYPDFILWIIEREKQHIIFIEPHGMLHAPAYENDEKARLHELLPQLSKEIAKRSKSKHVTLDAYIISATGYSELRRRYGDGNWSRKKFASKHILFMERSTEYDYLDLIFTQQLKLANN